MPEPVHVILNPASAGGRAARLQRRVEEILDGRSVSYRLRITEGPGHAVELAAAARNDGAPTVVAVGGDGTVHEVANGLLDDDAPAAVLPALAVVPVGTGNDFFRMVGSSPDPDRALTVLAEGRRRDFDVGAARWPGGERRFVNLLGVGVDVEVLRRREGFRRLSGLAQYLGALLVALLRFKPVPVRIVLDPDGPEEVLIRDRSHLTAVTVGPSAGGGFLLNPTARCDDGALDLCFVEALSYVEVLRYLPRVVRGTHADLPVVRLRRFRRARLESGDDVPLAFELDGELMPDPVPWIEVEVEPGRLPVLVPEPPGEEGRDG